MFYGVFVPYYQLFYYLVSLYYVLIYVFVFNKQIFIIHYNHNIARYNHTSTQNTAMAQFSLSYLINKLTKHCHGSVFPVIFALTTLEILPWLSFPFNIWSTSLQHTVMAQFSFVIFDQRAYETLPWLSFHFNICFEIHEILPWLMFACNIWPKSLRNTAMAQFSL